MYVCAITVYMLACLAMYICRRFCSAPLLFGPNFALCRANQRRFYATHTHTQAQRFFHTIYTFCKFFFLIFALKKIMAFCFPLAPFTIFFFKYLSRLVVLLYICMYAYTWPLIWRVLRLAD